MHDAVFIDDYPDFAPQTLGSVNIMAAWLARLAAACPLCTHAVRHEPIGLMVTVLYAARGFDGFAHYVVTSFPAHIWPLRPTIWLEVAAAAVLLATIGIRLVARQRLYAAASWILEGPVIHCWHDRHMTPMRLVSQLRCCRAPGGSQVIGDS